MIGITGIEQRQIGSIEEDAVEMLEIDVLARFAPVALEIEQSLVLIDINDLAGTKDP